MTLEPNSVSGLGTVVNKYQQIFASFSACLTMAMAGCCYSKSSFLLPQLQDEESSIRITIEEGSWFASIVVVGCLAGSILGGIQSDYFGRRKSLMIDNINFILGFAIIVLAPNFPVMLVGRFLTGISAASCLVSIPIYINEISQPQIKGFTASINMICYTSGFGAMAFMGALLPWRYALCVVTIFPIMGLIGLFWSHETPVWLMRKGREAEALAAFNFFRGDETIIKQEMALTRYSLEAIRGNEDQRNPLTNALKLFRRRDFIKPFCTVLGLVIGVELTGLPPLAFYMVPILKQTNIPIDPYWCAAFMTLYRAVISVGASGMVNRCRRRPILLGTGLLLAFSSGSLGFYTFLQSRGWLDHLPWTNWLPMVFISMLYTGFSCGYATVIYNYQGELLPPDARSFGCSLVGFIDNCVLFVIAKSIPTLTATIGIYGTFGSFSVITAVSVCGWYWILPETYGLTLEEINAIYKSNKLLPFDDCEK
eukprot:maker-scaffold254_size236139-snap-gene-0.10 protein:Tk02049 transcript:maker-scaffold254_size236139-snap-gene-0.10-mRNA-1 annotation:"solute carrier family facilitated glucose transporter member 8"